ncbi:MAG: hypothetical protein ACKOPN_02465 [Prochlorococcaceae cyanobacterium]
MPTTPVSPLMALRLPLLAAALLLPMAPAAAQVEKFILGPGSKVNPNTQVKPTDCVTDPTTKAMTCGTKLVNPPGTTPARPVFQPFRQ